MQYEGTVKWYDPKKAFGFLSGGPDGDVFVHRSQLGPERDELIEGQQVLFRTRASARGSEAYDVMVVKESSLPPRPRLISPERSRSSAPRNRLPAPRSASLPQGPVSARVISRDVQGRFFFVETERDGLEVFVHSSLVASLGGGALEHGDRVHVTLEQGPKGLRARSLDLA